jgi:hypothetical protein
MNTPAVTSESMASDWLGAVNRNVPRNGFCENESRWISLLSVPPVIVVAIVDVTVVLKLLQVAWKTAGVSRSWISWISFTLADPAMRSSITATVSGMTCETSAVIEPRVPAVVKRTVK